MTLEDFSYACGDRLFREVDNALLRYKTIKEVDFRVEVKVTIEAAKPAFRRHQHIIDSSDVEVMSPASRTACMLSDMRLASKTEAKRKAEEERRLDLVETTDRRVDLTKANRCNKTAYLNHGGLCWASRETGKHYALLSSEDGVLLRDPPPRLIASWRRIGPPLQYNPNNRRKRPSSTSPGDERKERQKPIREMKDDAEFERVQYQMQQARDRQMDYEDRRA